MTGLDCRKPVHTDQYRPVRIKNLYHLFLCMHHGPKITFQNKVLRLSVELVEVRGNSLAVMLGARESIASMKGNSKTVCVCVDSADREREGAREVDHLLSRTAQ